MNPTYVYVPVREELVEDVLRYTLEREPVVVSGERARRRSRPQEGFDPLENERYPELVQMDEELVRRAYRESSRLQQRMWEELSEHPGDPILWGELSDRLGESRHAVPGSIRQYIVRAEKQYEGQRLYHECKNQDGPETEWWIWLDERVARIVQKEASA